MQLTKIPIGESQTRFLELSATDSGSDVFEATVATLNPVKRVWGNEILDCSPEAVNLTRVSQGVCPFLNNHDQGQQIGVVLDAVALGDRVRAKIQWADSDCAQEVKSLIEKGFRRGLSVSYEIVDAKPQGENILVTKWALMEVSSVAVPADPASAIGRSQTDLQTRKGSNMTQLAERQTETLRQRSILALGDKYSKLPGAQILAEQLIENGTPLETARSQFMELIDDSRGSDRAIADSFDSWTNHRGETRTFSLGNVLRAGASERELTGFERETSDELRDVMARSGIKSSHTLIPKSAIVPTDFRQNQQRAAYLTSGGLGLADASKMIPQGYIGGEFIEYLRSFLGVMKAGARMLNVSGSPVRVPKKNAVSSLNWVTENSDLGESQPGFTEIQASPRTVGCWATISRLALQEASPDLENLLRADFMATLAEGIERAALLGSGAGANPRGIFNTVGIGTVAIGGAPTYPNFVDLWTKVCLQNSLPTGFLMNAQLAGFLKKTVQFASAGSDTIWQNIDAVSGSVAGLPAYLSNVIPSNLTKGSGTNLTAAVVGNWPELLIFEWGVASIEVNPYGDTNFRKGAVDVRLMDFLDVQVRHPESFALCNDISAPLP